MSVSLLKRLFYQGRDWIGRSQEDALFQRMVEQTSDVICHVTQDGFTYVSPSAKAVFGWDPASLLGTDGLGPVYEPDRAIILDVISRLVAGGTDQLTAQVRMVCGDGSLKWIEAITSRPARGGTFAGTVIVMRDITERKQAEDQMAALALQDGLTGLGNRRSFDQSLEREWRRTLQTGGEMALVLLDIDHFKDFNDLYGHQAGDDCLRVIATALMAKVRGPSDIACRYGGEELVMVLGGTNLDVATSIAEAVRQAIVELAIPHEGSSSSSYVTASIGVAAAVAREGGSNRMPEGLLHAADHALYRAKAAGRNRVERTILVAPSGDQTETLVSRGADRRSAG